MSIFEAIRPFGRQWCLVHSDAVARALRDEELRAHVLTERRRLRDVVTETLHAGFDAHHVRSLIPADDLAQLLIGVMVDLVTSEQLEGIDVGELSGAAILGILDAFTTGSAARA